MVLLSERFPQKEWTFPWREGQTELSKLCFHISQSLAKGYPGGNKVGCKLSGPSWSLQMAKQLQQHKNNPPKSVTDAGGRRKAGKRHKEIN